MNKCIMSDHSNVSISSTESYCRDPGENIDSFKSYICNEQRTVNWKQNNVSTEVGNCLCASVRLLCCLFRKATNACMIAWTVLRDSNAFCFLYDMVMTTKWPSSNTDCVSHALYLRFGHDVRIDSPVDYPAIVMRVRRKWCFYHGDMSKNDVITYFNLQHYIMNK